MPKRKTVTIIAYNGIDGACAAAMALTKHPDARVAVSSARSIGHSLTALGKERQRPAEIHVCGVGVYCQWDEVARAAAVLREKGVDIVWYCGRGYLDDQRDAFAEICTPVFQQASSNTEAVCRHLRLEKLNRSQFLLDLAQNDPNIDIGGRKPSKDDLFWIDLVSASYAEYAKYRDGDRYVATIRKLACAQRDAEDDRLVEVFRQSGFRYALEGRSPALRKLREMIRKCAAVDDPILILGESGVGKEHVAHLIHERGRRATEPFLAVNCATFAGNVGLANSALFGHRKGAFTGAAADRGGAFQTAAGGVLFLDELGQLPPEVQGKLLRVLEDGQITPEGADKPLGPVDVRVIAATNADLPAMVRRNEFRADLFYRLATLRIVVPPLRDRREDTDVIVESTLAELTDEGRHGKLTRQDRQALRQYDWPGNVRQLRQVLRRAALLEMPVTAAIAEESELGVMTATESTEPDGILPRSLDDVRPIKEIQRLYAQRVLSLHGGNLRQTAQALGVAVNTLRTWLKQP